MKNKKKFIKNSYSEAFDYIRESKNFIYSAIVIFIFFVLLGFFIPAPPILEAKIIEFIEELLRRTQGLSQIELIIFILWNNIQSSFTGMFFGIMLSIFPVLSALVNGYVLGFVASKVSAGSGFFVLWRLLPHGIFELPALFISLGLGLKLGTFVFQKNKLKTLREYLFETIRVFFFIIIPLLIIAAIIEGSLISLLG